MKKPELVNVKTGFLKASFSGSRTFLSVFSQTGFPWQSPTCLKELTMNVTLQITGEMSLSFFLSFSLSLSFFLYFCLSLCLSLSLSLSLSVSLRISMSLSLWISMSFSVSLRLPLSLSVSMFSNGSCNYWTTVKPVYNGHPWVLKKVAVWQRCLIKLRFRLAVYGSNWPLLTGGRCSQVVVKSGLTVYVNLLINYRIIF